MKEKINLLIISKKKIFFKKNIFFIKIKNNLFGNLEIYYKHTPIIIYLKKSYIEIFYKNKLKNIFIYKGFLEYINDNINILII